MKKHAVQWSFNLMDEDATQHQVEKIIYTKYDNYSLIQN